MGLFSDMCVEIAPSDWTGGQQPEHLQMSRSKTKRIACLKLGVQMSVHLCISEKNIPLSCKFRCVQKLLHRLSYI